MRIAICSLSQFTYVAEFIDAAQGLNEKHEVCYFMSFYCHSSIKLLQKRHLSYQFLLDERIHIKSALIDPATACSTYEVFRGFFFEYAESFLPFLLKTLVIWKPDLILSHYRDYAGMTAAEILGIPMISFGTAGSPIRVEGVDPPYAVGVSRDTPNRVMRILWKLNHEFNQKLDQLYNDKVRRPYGLHDISGVNTLHSNQLTFLMTIPSLSNKSSPDPSYLNFVGSLFSTRSDSMEVGEADMLARIATSPKPRILVALGTIHLEPTKKCLEALESFSGTVVVSLGGKPEIEIGSFARYKNIICTPFITDFFAVLKLVDAVVSVASGKTVIESLSVGKPLICLPRQGEQKENALLLQTLGAGAIPCPKSWSSQMFAEVTERVATEESYKKAAAVLQTETQEGGGVDKVVRLIEQFSC